jgi:CSLREA domain-containing protein
MLLQALAFATVPLTPGTAAAVSFVVNSALDATDVNPGDGICLTAGGVCTLRAAVQEANNLAGPDDVFIAGSGTITLTIAGAGENAAATGDLDVTDDLAVNGSGQAETIVDADGLDRVFHVLGSASLEIVDMTLRGGVASGGGAIECEEGSLTVDSVILEKNEASAGGGGAINGQAACDEIETSRTTMRKNEAGFGGAIASTSVSGAVRSEEDLFEKNKSVGGGGGAIFTSSTTFMEIYESRFSKNSSGLGGAIQALGHLDIYRSTFDKNKSSGHAGAIFCQDECNISESSFTKNKATGAGGAIAQWGLEPMFLNSSWIMGNSASTDGGGVYVGGQTNLITSVTLMKNKATGSGGGLYLHGTNTVINVTLSGNKSSNGGAVHVGSGTTTVTNTIIDGTCGTPITSGGTNIETGNTCGLNGVGDQANTDPLLSGVVLSPFNNAGLGVLPLLMGSPAIDAGVNAGCTGTNDGRGLFRPRDGDGDGIAECDIGAYETVGGF